MRINIANVEINGLLLHEQFKSALPTVYQSMGIDDHKFVTLDDSATQADIDTIHATVSAHNPNDQTEYQQALAVQSSAETQASNIPNWATWTEVQALAWFDAHIGDDTDAIPADITGLSQANLVNVIQALVTINKAQRTALHAMVRMQIAQRNKLFPNLQE